MGVEIVESQAARVFSELVKIDSQNPGGSEKACVERSLELLRELGCPVPEENMQLFEIGPGRSCMVIDLPGLDESRCVGFAGHLDTVPVGNSALWTHDPLSAYREGDVIWGRGSADMKGGDAAMLLLYASYALSGEKPPVSLRFLFTADEESGGLGMRRLVDEGCIDNLSFLFICEPTACSPGVCEKGCAWVTLDVMGSSSHASMPELGINALELGFSCGMSAKSRIETLSGAHPLLGRTTCTLTLADGGTKTNMVPQHAGLTFDVRFVPGVSVSQVVGAFEESAAKVCESVAGLSIDIRVSNCREPFEISADDPRVRFAESVCEREGGNPAPSGVMFYTDGSLVVPEYAGLPILVLGPGDPGQCHTIDERASVSGVINALRIYRRWLEGCVSVL